MSAAAPLRVAMLTYSVRPRGGVVHAIAVAEALAARGHAVELFAVGPPGAAFFRVPEVPAAVVPHEPPPDVGFDAKIASTIATYRDGLRPILRDGGFDVVHAQDCISANAALALRDEGLIPAVIRTVHHVDDFRSPSLIACQIRSIAEPDHVLCVSPPWIGRVHDEFGVEAGLVGNGVDPERYRPARDEAERRAARDAAGLNGRLAILTVGGIEPRKGSLTLLEGFAAARDALPGRRPVLLVAGGATLFDYRDEIDRFHTRAAELGLDGDLRVLGAVEDAELEGLYRAADVFALPSTKEGFGLAVLEALAAGLPAVVSDLEVFRGFLGDGASALLARTGDPDALAEALVRVARDPALAERLRAGGREVAARHTWARVAEAHEAAYRDFLGARLMAEGLEVTARWRGGYRADVEARGHEVVVDEPAHSGGEDMGFMPTELFCGALASCFCLAIGHVARKRAIDVPGLLVRVRSERAGRELRYARFLVACAADVDDAVLDMLIERARPFCWVSNTLAAGVEVEYGRLT